jgi:hypothetical protein
MNGGGATSKEEEIINWQQQKILGNGFIDKIYLWDVF